MVFAYSFAIDIEADSRQLGMFLLARLIMDYLLDQDCHEDLEEELNSEELPDEIDQASVSFKKPDRSCTEVFRYARILERTQKKNQSKRRWDRAKVGLNILTTAMRSLKVQEIQGALSIHLEDKSVDFEKRRSVIPLEELLGPLVEVHSDDSVNFYPPHR